MTNEEALSNFGMVYLAVFLAVFFMETCGPASCHDRETKSKLNSIESKLNDIESKLGSIESNLNSIDDDLNSLKNRCRSSARITPTTIPVSIPPHKCKVTVPKKIPPLAVKGAPELVLKCVQPYNDCSRHSTIFCGAEYRDRDGQAKKARTVCFKLQLKCGKGFAVAFRCNVIEKGTNRAVVTSINPKKRGGLAGTIASLSVWHCSDIDFVRAVSVEEVKP